jgi:hypothetical protein
MSSVTCQKIHQRFGVTYRLHSHARTASHATNSTLVATCLVHRSTVLKSVAKKRLVKTKDFYVICGYSDNWSVWFNETVIITVLKSVAKKRLVKTEDLCELWLQ